MKRAVVALAMLAALLPAGSSALSTPDPATLKTALADPPSSGYVEATDGTTGEGAFDSSGYASAFVSDASLRPAVETRLANDSFVSGYSRLWAETGAGAALIEAILAFKDKAGASSYFGSAKLADEASVQLTGTVDTSGIPNSYGVKDKAASAELVAVGFVKGNDLFVVGFASTTTYLESDTVTQAQNVYSAAPDYTIQPASSVGTGASNLLASKAGAVIIDILIAAVGLVILLAIIWFVMSRRRRPALQPAAAGAMIQMSSDSRSWWDGSSWQDANTIAPAHAQRTPDGAYWWDGQAWHPVPR